jgi:hypothetical protein
MTKNRQRSFERPTDLLLHSRIFDLLVFSMCSVNTFQTTLESTSLSETASALL